ncbi:ABC-type transport system involved in resistance to organic solvents, periplasmic component [Candidatus Terasakiella magnetica]|uniref:ABC-type transport system involved in resistance to organic solvents, periplasmic component n=1 Tax=Candidatus Terasakiella magnetica TaxID=1867952 RepID=A0A1C3RJD2_9PROT|nr:MlaD family protein [Candidatus Terasakiella magnetica]SCA57347.1 ABC-type transport system involved in resistance to organic solvents, periplasmic component [Candidatus Terasakiella magnetica]
MSALKNAKMNYMIVGSFVIASIVCLIIAVALLTGRTGSVDTYYTLYNRVQGLKFGTQVVYEGYPVGQIEQIIPEKHDGRMRFRVEMSVAEGWDIPQDSVAAVSSAGLLSALTINIRAGDSPTPLTPGDKIMGIENADMFAAMSSLAEQISSLMETDVRPLLLSLNTAVNSVFFFKQKTAYEIATKLKDIIDEIGVRTPQIADNLESFSTDLNSSGSELAKILSPNNRQKINSTIADLDKLGSTLEKADHMVGNMDNMVTDSKPEMEKAIADLRFVMETLSRHIDTISQNLEGTSRNMYEFSRHIRQNPGLLLGGTPPTDKAR